jgi:hypothetical protein
VPGKPGADAIRVAQAQSRVVVGVVVVGVNVGAHILGYRQGEEVFARLPPALRGEQDPEAPIRLDVAVGVHLAHVAGLQVAKAQVPSFVVWLTPCKDAGRIGGAHLTRFHELVVCIAGIPQEIEVHIIIVLTKLNRRATMLVWRVCPLE